MKKNEIIELDGKEYTLELNRDSFIQIDRACNIQKSMDIIYRNMYDYLDEQELDDNFNPELLLVNDDDLDKEVELKNKTLEKLVVRAFIIWLYPNHKLTPTQVKELVMPYLEDEEKSKWIGSKVGEYLQECINIRDEYNQERKNLKAQANKK